MRHPMSIFRITAGVALAFIAWPARAQTTQFEEMMMGDATPVTLKLGDLKGGWRQVAISAALEPATRGGANGPNNPGQPGDLLAKLGASPGQYFTQGKVVLVGGETFLVAYQLEFNEQNLSTVLSSLVTDRKEPIKPEVVTQAFEKFTRDSDVHLVLINARNVGSIRTLRSFDLDGQLAPLKTVLTREVERETPALPNPAAATISPADPVLFNLTQLGAAVTTYIQENAGVLPPLDDAAVAQKALLPYARTAEIFVKPGTAQTFVPNPILSGRKTAHISNPQEFVLYYDANPGNKPRAVLFLDGHAARVADDLWPRFKKASKMP